MECEDAECEDVSDAEPPTERAGGSELAAPGEETRDAGSNCTWSQVFVVEAAVAACGSNPV